jgi:hypothetical protein
MSEPCSWSPLAGSRGVHAALCAFTYIDNILARLKLGSCWDLACWLGCFATIDRKQLEMNDSWKAGGLQVWAKPLMHMYYMLYMQGCGMRNTCVDCLAAHVMQCACSIAIDVPRQQVACIQLTASGSLTSCCGPQVFSR